MEGTANNRNNEKRVKERTEMNIGLPQELPLPEQLPIQVQNKS